MRVATFVLASVVGLLGCNDVRDFAGQWAGERVGSSPVLRVGEGLHATLTIDAIDTHGLRGHMLVVGEDVAAPVVNSDFSSLPSAEADALASMTFAGSPLRVYLAFVPLEGIGAGDAFAFISLYDSRRIELRLMQGGSSSVSSPLYAIYALTESD